MKSVGMGGSWVVNSRSMSTRVIAVAAAPPAAPPYSMSFALASRARGDGVQARPTVDQGLGKLDLALLGTLRLPCAKLRASG